MEISTVLKITLEEIKQLLADKHGINHYFELQILDFDGTVLSSGVEQPKQPKQPKQTEEAPWYPDDRGEWVEVYGGKRPQNLKDNELIEVILEHERMKKDWYDHCEIADYWFWPEVVAYKKVK